MNPRVTWTLFLLICKLSASPRTLLGFQYAFKNIPSPEKKDKGGEDAWYVHDYLLSVADGVGGWNLQGVDPAKYSRKLEANVRQFFSRNENLYRENPKNLMQIAADNNKETGSSTFVIVTIDPKKALLRTSLLGDSSYMILRIGENDNYESVFRSEEQQHSFNFPFQCGTNGDPISSAVENSHSIQVNDLVIVGTDGVFDNLFDSDIIQVVNRLANSSLEVISEAIGDLAYEKSLDKSWLSPFAVGARKGGYEFVGGKSDDITLVVGMVKEAIFD